MFLFDIVVVILELKQKITNYPESWIYNIHLMRHRQ